MPFTSEGKTKRPHIRWECCQGKNHKHCFSEKKKKDLKKVEEERKWFENYETALKLKESKIFKCRKAFILKGSVNSILKKKEKQHIIQGTKARFSAAALHSLSNPIRVWIQQHKEGIITKDQNKKGML